MRLGEQFFFVFIGGFRYEHLGVLIVPERRLLIVFRFVQKLFGGELRSLPVTVLDSVLDRLFLAGAAMSVVLLICFFECV